MAKSDTVSAVPQSEVIVCRGGPCDGKLYGIVAGSPHVLLMAFDLTTAGVLARSPGYLKHVYNRTVERHGEATVFTYGGVTK